MSAAEKIALVSVLSTAAVGIAGLWLAKRGADNDRKHRERDAANGRAHVERLARAERHYRARLDAYNEAGRILEVSRLFVARTFPIITIGEPPQPPEPLGDAEWTVLWARIAIASSRDALEAIKAAHDEALNFAGAASVFAASERRPARTDEDLKARVEMDGARQRALAAIDEAQKVMREELEAL